MKYLKKFDTNTEYQQYISGKTAVFPNVSLVNDEIKYTLTAPYNIVGNYVYSDLTIGNEVRDDIVGVIAIPAYVCPDGYARMIAINALNKENLLNSYQWKPNYNKDSAEWTDGTYHATTKYVKINEGQIVYADGGLLIENAGLSDSKYYEFDNWIEFDSEMREALTEGLLYSQNNSNLAMIKLDGNGYLLNYDVGPEPYLEGDKINPNFSVLNTVTNDWDFSNQELLKSEKDSVFNACSNLSIKGVTGWHVPTITEAQFILAKLGTIRLAMKKAGYNPVNPISYGLWFWTSTYNQVLGGGPCCWDVGLNGDYGCCYWGSYPGSGGLLLPLRRLVY